MVEHFHPHRYLTRALYKIGLSRSLEQRFEMMQRSSPLPLEIVWTVDTKHPFALEDALHRLYAKGHSHGEWYWLTATQFAWVLALDEETIERLIAAREKARLQEKRQLELKRNARMRVPRR